MIVKWIDCREKALNLVLILARFIFGQSIIQMNVQ